MLVVGKDQALLLRLCYICTYDSSRTKAVLSIKCGEQEKMSFFLSGSSYILKHNSVAN